MYCIDKMPKCRNNKCHHFENWVEKPLLKVSYKIKEQFPSIFDEIFLQVIAFFTFYNFADFSFLQSWQKFSPWTFENRFRLVFALCKQTLLYVAIMMLPSALVPYYVVFGLV